MKIERIDPEENLSELVELAKVEYGDAEIANPDYLRWQYLDNPAGKAIVVVARSQKDELAGQYVVIPTEFRIHGELQKGSVSLNTLTHPDYRGQGLFTKMANETYAVCEREGLHLTLGFPNKNSYPGFVRKLQFRHIGNAAVMFRPLGIFSLAGSLPAMNKAAKYAPSDMDGAPVANFFLHSGALDISPLDFQDEWAAYDELVNTVELPRYTVHKSAAFCSWRFQKVPTRRYQSFQARDRDGMKAACVIRQRKVKGIECIFFVDFIMDGGPDGIAAGKSLLKAVLQRYRKSGVALAGMMVNRSTDLHRLARSAWFREMPSQLLPHDAPVIVRRNGTAISESIFDVADWALSFGDYDVF